MDLKTISSSGAWGSAAADVNENFSRTNVEIEKLKRAAAKFKGYHTSFSALSVAVPSPAAGDYAWAGTPYPGTVYECKTVGQWVNTGQAPDTPGVDLNNWNQTDW